MKVRDLYHKLHRAPIVTSRGSITKELINIHYTVSNYFELFAHKERGLSLDYIKREIEWYVKGNRWDDSIVKHAKIWAHCIGKDGGINSNYGQYLFGSGQLVRVINELRSDRYSRRAVAMILGQHPLHWSGIDQPCTTSIQFLIRNNELHLIVTMRSQDAIFGLGNDVPAFMFIGKVVASCLGLELCDLNINVGSIHIYERHFGMVERIVNDTNGWRWLGYIPEISAMEALSIINSCTIPEDSKLYGWLKNESL